MGELKSPEFDPAYECCRECAPFFGRCECGLVIKAFTLARIEGVLADCERRSDLGVVAQVDRSSSERLPSAVECTAI